MKQPPAISKIRTLVGEAFAQLSGELAAWFKDDGAAALAHTHGSVQMALKRFDEETEKAITREFVVRVFDEGFAAGVRFCK